ncbi:reverse transcriptase domain-containing protein [Brucella pseudogrignonensis]|uniref:reverse transcriptase domain-containing protein n=1 Tax=Brucella pseudogrignonensis TaxID=419475 RepID=UPI00286AE811|nr:reverse transcriptase domain-containing protein [Brucella pseudogrignonensis]
MVSPILSNLFLHYAFDLWMTRTHPDLRWCRYADDGLVHCQSEQQAEALKVELGSRLAECGLQMHPTKTKGAGGDTRMSCSTSSGISSDRDV